MTIISMVLKNEKIFFTNRHFPTPIFSFHISYIRRMTTEIFSLITMIVTILFGFLSKKISWFKNYLIPLQNLTIGIVFAIVEFLITKDFNLAVATSGLMAGGTYDLVKNLQLAYQEMRKKDSSPEES